MFFARKTPKPARPDRLAALRLSLNAPVVNTEEMPSGPARAAIALFLEGEGRSSLEVRVRSVETGKIVAYGFDGSLGSQLELERAMEGALTFAESMGFLFDEDVVSGDAPVGSREVADRWGEFEAGQPVGARRRAPTARPEVEPELELTEVAKGDAALVMELSSGWTPDGSAAVGGSPPAAKRPAPKSAARPAAKVPPAAAGPAPEAETLSKFRGRKAQPAATALGRVPIVRRRGSASKERPSFLARLLGAF